MEDFIVGNFKFGFWQIWLNWMVVCCDQNMFCSFSGVIGQFNCMGICEFCVLVKVFDIVVFQQVVIDIFKVIQFCMQFVFKGILVESIGLNILVIVLCVFDYVGIFVGKDYQFFRYIVLDYIGVVVMVFFC